MTRWLRFLLALVSARGGSKITIADPTELTFRVWPTDCDAAFMNNASFLTLCEAARLDFLVRSGLFAVARKRGLYLPMAAVLAQYRRPVRRFAAVTVTTRIASWTGSEVWVEQRVSSGGKLAAIVVERGMLKEGRRTLTMDEIVSELWPGAVSPELPAWLEQLKSTDAALREVPG